MKDQTIFNSLRFRAGYGETGNQEFPSDAALTVYRFSGSSSARDHAGNDSLKWETVKSVDIGVDFAILKGRVYGTVDYFAKKTTDVLFQFTFPQPGPQGSIFRNIDGADLTNKGVEFSLGADIIQKAKLNWSVNLNATFVKNKFNFPESGNSPFAFTGALNGQGTSGAFAEAIVNGQPINVFFVKKFQGFDKDGVAVYDSEVPSFVGNPNPTSFVGFATDLSYGKFGLNLGAHGAFGNKIYNNTAMSVLNISNIAGGRNIDASILKTGEAPSNYIAPSTRYIESGNFLKLNNATIRYTIGDIGKNKVVKGLNVYLTGNNLFVITKYKGFDPEVNVDKALNGIPSVGIDYIGYPTQRTILLGCNFSL